MRLVLKVIPVLLALALASCGGAPVATESVPLAPAAGPAPADQARALRERNVNQNQQQNTADGTVAPAPPVDTSRRFEYADVYVNLGDPVGQRALVPYLIKPEEWTLIQSNLLSPTYRHYRFQRIVGTDGRSLPDVDPLRPRRPESAQPPR